jgi:hypothetical protein
VSLIEDKAVGALPAAAVGDALGGATALPKSWVDPLGERFPTTLPGFDRVTLTELTARTCAVAL